MDYQAKKESMVRVSFLKTEVEASDFAQGCVHFVHPGMPVSMSSAQAWTGD